MNSVRLVLLYLILIGSSLTIDAGDTLPLKTPSKMLVGVVFGRRHVSQSRSISDDLSLEALGYFVASVASFSKAVRRMYIDGLKTVSSMYVLA